MPAHRDGAAADGGMGGQEALFHLVVRLHSVISKSQKLGGGDGGAAQTDEVSVKTLHSWGVQERSSIKAATCTNCC